MVFVIFDNNGTSPREPGNVFLNQELLSKCLPNNVFENIPNKFKDFCKIIKL